MLYEAMSGRELLKAIVEEHKTIVDNELAELERICKLGPASCRADIDRQQVVVCNARIDLYEALLRSQA